MCRWKLGLVLTVVAYLAITNDAMVAQPKSKGAIPVRGDNTPNVETLDAVMLKYLPLTKSGAATLAIAKDGKILHARGYGWIDQNRSVPTPPNAMIGIASCDKPITVALIRLIGRRGLIRLDGGFFEAFQFKSRGKVIDPRVHKITIQHALEHKAGWSAADADSWLTDWLGGAAPESILERAMTRTLAYDPGEKYAYCNIGYDLLRVLAQRKLKKPWDECFRTELFKPVSHMEISATSRSPGRKQPRGISVVWNAKEGGPTCASAAYLCLFMKHYWYSGEPREGIGQQWAGYGSLAGSTAIMVWRPDGIDVVALFNGRGAATHDQIRAELERAVNGMAKK
jgi:CubicO group peptidase (beta-lactamase class C family)